MSIILLLAGLVILTKSADYLIDGASAFARRKGVPTLFIGLTIVAFGTSLPEFFVNITAALQGSTEVAMGNVVGSNIANLLLVLGIATLIHPPRLAHSTVWKEIPFSLLAAVALLVLANTATLDHTNVATLSRSSGIILLLFMGAFLYYLFNMAVKGNDSLIEESSEKELSPATSYTFIVIGVIGLYFGGTWTVEGAVRIASSLGISDYVISATIIAFGTSFPELITSVKAALRGNSDLAVGNIIGSNIFNIFWILGATAVIAPVTLPSGINIDLMILVVATLILFISMFLGRIHHFDRLGGGLFLSSYLAYIGFLIMKG